MLSRAQIDAALPKLGDGVRRYRELQTTIHAAKFSASLPFRRKYCYFYGITPHRDAQWQSQFFDLLVSVRYAPMVFSDALDELHNRTRCVEASFASKLVASVNTDLPVIDKYVLLNAGLRLPYPSHSARIAEIKRLYAKLDSMMRSFLGTPDGRHLVAEFGVRYSTTLISEIKMLDFVLWQTR